MASRRSMIGNPVNPFRFYHDRLALRPAGNPEGATMATKKPKPRPTPETHTWTVTIDGSPVTVTAQILEIITPALVFWGHDNEVIRAVAAGHWSNVELVPPVDPAELADPPIA